MRIKLLALLVLVALMAAACGGTTPTTTEEAVATVETAVEEVAPTTEAAAEEEPAAEVEATMAPEATEEPAMTEGDGMLPMADPLAVSGDIVTAGSSTVFPLTERIAERYQSEGFAGQITIDSIGTGAGFERFCDCLLYTSPSPRDS